MALKANPWSVYEINTFLTLVADERIQRELDGTRRNERVFAQPWSEDRAHREKISSPRLLPLKGCGKVVQAACGGSQVAILNDKGEVFVWGYGILGKGPKLSESSTPEMIPPTLFGRTDFNPSVSVSRIRCGLSHFAAITDRGELFVWGKNVRGCLGIGKRDDQFFPWRVTVPGAVVDVACGVDHMVALAKSLL